MRFRFSLKWLLLVMVYAAVAAAAFSHGHWAYADLLWTASIVAFGYALLLIFVERGPSQTTALGFVIFFACYLMCLFVAPDSLPTSHLLVALGAAGDDPTIAQQPIVAPPSAWQLRSYAGGQPPGNIQVQGGTLMLSSGMATITQTPANPASVGKSYMAALSFPLKLRAANAVGSMAAGLVGCLLASVVCRRRPSAATEVSP